jgi:hypothetical protein
VALKSPSGYRLFVSWGALEKVEKLKDVDGHADYSIERIKGSREAVVKNVKRQSVSANGHKASLNDIDVELVSRGLFFNKTTTQQKVRSLHVHCDVSSRYFVIYSPATPEKSQEQGDVVSRMVKSFVCH